MKPSLSPELKNGFSERLNRILDRRHFPKHGRAARLGEKYGVTTSAAAAWLRGSVPTLDVVVQMATDLQVSVGWLIANESSGASGLDRPRLSRSIDAVFNALIDRRVMTTKIESSKFALLVDIAYSQLEKAGDVSLEAAIELALPA